MSRNDQLCWFHGKLSRESAEELVKREGLEEDGVFLVRESNTAAGDFVLTLLHQGVVCHYQIRRHGEDAFFSIDAKVKILHGLDTLVEFYQQAANGLVTKLSTSTHIRCEPPPNDSRSHGVTNLLHRATKENNQTVVSELLKCGYRNVDAKNQDGQTAVHLAALHCDEEILRLLLAAGVNVNCMDTSGHMPLHYACRSGKSASFIRTLIAANANVQGRNIKNGYVPLHVAAKHGNSEAVRELLAANAPLLPRTSFGEFPIDLAKEAGQEEVVAFLNSYKPPAATTFEQQWYHGTLNREEAIEALLTFAANMEKLHEQRLLVAPSTSVVDEAAEASDVVDKQKEDSLKHLNSEVLDTSGCFLVRYSERKTAGSGYVLTMLWNKVVRNFIISQSSNYLYIDDGPYLPSLEHLVEHFMRFSDGLPGSLKYAVLPKPKPPLPLFSTMPRAFHKKFSADALLAPSASTAEQQQNPSVVVTTKPAIADVSFERKHSLDALKATASSEKHSQTLSTKKSKQKENSGGSVFNTLRLRSPKKSIIIESMNSLRKSKFKTKAASAVAVGGVGEDEKNVATSPKSHEDQLKHTEMLLKSLSFSTDFANLKMDTQGATGGNGTATSTDSFYNVPKNNSAIAGGDLGATADASSGGLQCGGGVSTIAFESKTEAEVEYFTKSDVAIEQERMSDALEQYNNLPPKFVPNANGYVPTVDIRVFIDQGPLTPGGGIGETISKEALEASAAELREFSNHPERLESMISNVSNESEINRYFNRQNSNASTVTQLSSTTTPTPAQPKFNYFIPRDCLELDAIIGEGEFGSVYKGCIIVQRGTGAGSATDGGGASATEAVVRREVAIKTLRDEHCRTNKQEFLREASVMIRLQHHCVLQLIGISKGETLMMVQELVPLGSMLHFILDNKQSINPNYELKLWASQIACGMQYLESYHFVHRDLAARNILLASRNQAKISDFGLSRALGCNDCYQASQGGKWPIKWYAPESFNNGLFSHASDVWSFGVTLWEMFSLGEAPYGEIRGVEAIEQIESGERLPQPSICPADVYEIMQSCWHYKPKDRPTFRYLTDYFGKNPDYQNLMELIKTEHIS